MKVCVITGTRAEYGLLYWTMKLMDENPNIQLYVCLTGMHLSPEFGYTCDKVKEDGFVIDHKVEMLLSSDSAVGISKSIGLGIIGFSDYFEQLKPDWILVLGDRFEIFSAVSAAMIAKIPVCHCHGGESTEGLIDEAIRHSITKMSHLHFASTERYRKRIIQLGEQPNKVFNSGALGIENINRIELLNRQDFENKINFKLSKLNFLVTFHPVTLENYSADEQFNELLDSLRKIKKANIIFTKPNADHDGRGIIKLIDLFVNENKKRSISFISMGQLLYLSAIKHCDIVIGNSSSGLIEAPSFKKPTIDIGDRQRGRIKSKSVLNCEPFETSISKSIEFALSESFQKKLKLIDNPYDNGNSSEIIVNKILETSKKNILKKKFYNT
tara:strand:- start:1528 stop:2679 length:1152 start_codon:yes stop_codon:yes gene_type:complete